MKKSVEEALERAVKALTIAAEFRNFNDETQEEIVNNIFVPVKAELVALLEKNGNGWIKNLRREFDNAKNSI